MNSQQQIEYLENIPDTYTGAPLPCATDAKILEIVSGVINGTSDERQELYAAITKKASSSLQLFGQRMSMLSVRKKSADLLLRGMVAMTMVKKPDERSMAIRLTLLYRSAQLLGLDADEFFQQSVQYMQGISPSIGHTISFLERTPRLKGVESMGYREVDGPSGLVYVAGHLSGVPAGLLYENEPVIPDEVVTFFTDVESKSWYSPTETLYFNLRDSMEIPDRIEEQLMGLLQNGSHDARVALALGGLEVNGASEILEAHLKSDTGEFLLNFKIDAALALWWITQAPQALEFLVKASRLDQILGTGNQVAIALQYFECGQAIEALREMLDQERDFVTKDYIIDSLLVLCDPDGVVEKSTLTSKMRSRDPQVKQELFNELDDLIAQRALPDCGSL